MGSVCSCVRCRAGLWIGYAGCFVNNADLPAMPQNNSETLCQQTGTPHYMHSGLTKREYFAGLAMQGIVMHTTMSPDLKHAAERSVFMADALLAELERTK